MTDTYKGKVKWYSIRKGFGFVTPSGDDAPTKDDIFFHQTSILSDVKNKWLVRSFQYWVYGGHLGFGFRL